LAALRASPQAASSALRPPRRRVGLLLRHQQPLVVFARELRIDRQPHRAVVPAPGQTDRELDPLAGTLTHLDIGLVLLGDQQVLQ
jgi:hypothetical protein